MMNKLPLALLLAGFSSFTAAQASQVMTLPTLTRGPQTRCVAISKPQPKLLLLYKDGHFKCYQNNKVMQNGTFISFEEVSKGAKHLSGSFEKVNGEYRLTLSGGSTTYEPNFIVGPKSYVDAIKVFSSFMNLQSDTTPIIVRNYTNPELKLGQNRLKTATPWLSKDSKFFYAELHDAVIQRLFYSGPLRDYITILAFSAGDITEPSLSKNPNPTTVHYQRRTLKVNAPSGNVVMSLSKMAQDTFIVDVAPVDRNGQISLHTAQDTYFVSSPEKLTPYRKGKPLPTMLLKITNTPFNQLQKGVLLPH